MNTWKAIGGHIYSSHDSLELFTEIFIDVIYPYWN